MIDVTLQHTEHGPTSVEQALTLFREFSWTRALADANRFDTSTPTILLDDTRSGCKLAASIVDGPPQCDQFEFLMVYVVPGQPHAVAFNSAGHGMSAVELAMQAFYGGDEVVIREILRVDEVS